MKKLVFLTMAFLMLSAGLFAQDAGTGSVATNNDTVPEITKKNVEVGLNIFGIFIGSYTARVEFSAISEGMVSLGLRGTYNNQMIGDTGLTGIQALLEARVYPARYMRGFYILVEGGYNTSSVSVSGETLTLTSAPFMGGLGWKWVINEFSIDTGFGYGKTIYLNQPDSSLLDLNSFPWNFAFDGYLLVGYRF